eukprot:2380668-Rhodomonas_salina.2
MRARVRYAAQCLRTRGTVGDLWQARQPEASAWLQVWVVNTSGVIDRLRAGDSVSDARCAAELQWSSTG